MPGLADLASQLGARMGIPVECAHTDARSGDTLQATTTGLAFLRHANSDTSIFTDGASHVALTPQGLVSWDGPSVAGPLALARDGVLPMLCRWLTFRPGTNGFLCVYLDTSFAAWAAPAVGDNWLLLGTEASSDAPWQLTATGREVLGGGATVVPRNPPAIEAGPPPDATLEITLDPVTPPFASSFAQLSGRVCNPSSTWTASSVRLEFELLDETYLPILDRPTTTVQAVPPRGCVPFMVSFTTSAAWQSARIARASATWQR